jgi:hypothetical protein
VNDLLLVEYLIKLTSILLSSPKSKSISFLDKLFNKNSNDFFILVNIRIKSGNFNLSFDL